MLNLVKEILNMPYCFSCYDMVFLSSESDVVVVVVVVVVVG